MAEPKAGTGEKIKQKFNLVKQKIMFWKKPPAKTEKKKKKTWLDETKEWIVSFVVMAVVYFVILPAILSTSSPMVVVSSCSEAGYLNIGDILVLQGVDIKDVNAPLVELSSLSNFRPIIKDNKVTEIDFLGQIIKENDSNDIIVYAAYPTGSQIIHRAFAKIRIGDNYFLITKGDANPIPDQLGVVNNTLVACLEENPGLCISTPITQKMLIGKKILFQIPILGHLKLFFCDIMPFCDGHSNAGTNYEFMLWC